MLLRNSPVRGPYVLRTDSQRGKIPYPSSAGQGVTLRRRGGPLMHRAMVVSNFMLLVLFTTPGTWAQQFVWARQFDGDQARDVAVDGSGTCTPWAFFAAR